MFLHTLCGNSISCSFTPSPLPFPFLSLSPPVSQVSLRNGFAVAVDEIDVQSVGGVHTAYVLSSVHLAHTARLPAFDSDLSRSFFIGVQSTSGQPLIVSPPAGSAAQVIVSLRWCTTADAFPTTAPPPHTVEHINTTVALAGYQASTAAGGDSGDSGGGGGGGVTFSDQGSWIYRDDDRTLVEYKWEEEGRRRRGRGEEGREGERREGMWHRVDGVGARRSLVTLLLLLCALQCHCPFPLLSHSHRQVH